MKFHTRIAILLLCTLVFTTCKKGKDDPFFSFLTRKARLAGEWRMKQGAVSLTTTEASGTITNDSYSFDGTNLSLNTTESGGPPTIYVGKYLLNITIKKDGTFSMTETITGTSSTSLKANGTWNFTSGVGKAKKKDSVVMRITDVSSGSSGSHLFNKFGAEFTYSITELRNKELALESDGNIYLGSGSDQLSYRNTFKFENKQ